MPPRRLAIIVLLNFEACSSASGSYTALASRNETQFGRVAYNVTLLRPPISCLVRQRPGTVSGVIFATLQDESGDSNAIIWPTDFDKYRRETLGSKLMIIEGKVQKRVVVMDGAEQKTIATIHVIADSIENGNAYLGELGDNDIDADFNILSKADEMKSPLRQPKEVLVALPDSREYR